MAMTRTFNKLLVSFAIVYVFSVPRPALAASFMCKAAQEELVRHLPGGSQEEVDRWCAPKPAAEPPLEMERPGGSVEIEVEEPETSVTRTSPESNNEPNGDTPEQNNEPKSKTTVDEERSVTLGCLASYAGNCAMNEMQKQINSTFPLNKDTDANDAPFK
jgi:hypothetical protein